ncbi:MAG TPA: four helix bundle protein [Candidatus Kapabacteria bacterium]|nr:four helix bundle protein [Candidatus Kapabacteria bacterium]
MKDSGFNNDKIKEKTQELVSSINLITQKIPNGQIYQIAEKLRKSADSVPKYIELGLNENARKYDKIRFLIMANSVLEDCRTYLSLAETLKYAYTKDIIEQINSVNDLIADDCPAINIISKKLEDINNQ